MERLLAPLLAVFVGGCAPTASGDLATKPLASSAADAVAQAIAVEEDATVFTLFALLNGAGYDTENSAGAMHPARLEVRRMLALQLPPALQTEIRNYYAGKGPRVTPWHYSVAAMSTSGPPDFRPTAEWTDEISRLPDFAKLSDLHPLLRRFHRQARVPSLYRKVRPAYVSYIAAYNEVVRQETGAVLTYLRVGVGDGLVAGSGEQGRARVIPNLLESYETAFSFKLGGRFISVEGAQKKIGYNPHEFVHAVTNPLSYDPRHAGLQAPAGALVAEARKAMGEGAATKSIAAFMDECLVRAISLRYLARGDPARLARLENVMLEEYRQGYILERFFWERLADFEAKRESLAEAYPRMLAQLDAEAELDRWQAARAAKARNGGGRRL